jgi:hypothetical protein
MAPETVEHVLVWEVWFTHSHCRACRDRDDAGPLFYAEWREAADDIQARITGRPDGCELDAIVDRVSMPKTKWDALPETTTS